MNINYNYFNAIKPVLEKLNNLLEGDWVLFGSTTLYLLGILDFEGLDNIHDLDVVLDGQLSEKTEAETVYFENDPDKKLYKLKVANIEIDVGTLWPGEEYWFNLAFKDPIVVKNFKFANLDSVLEWKKEIVRCHGREKDKKYVCLIEKYLACANQG